MSCRRQPTADPVEEQPPKRFRAGQAPEQWGTLPPHLLTFSLGDKEAALVQKIVDLASRCPTMTGYDCRWRKHRVHRLPCDGAVEFASRRVLDNSNDFAVPNWPGLRVDLTDAQRRSLSWMLTKEAGSKDELVVERGCQNARWSTHRGIDFQLRLSYTLRGGILADDIGYGKTLLAAALTAASLGEDFQERKGRPPCHPTLIFVPEYLVNQWLSEFSKAFGEMVETRMFGVGAGLRPAHSSSSTFASTPCSSSRDHGPSASEPSLEPVRVLGVLSAEGWTEMMQADWSQAMAIVAPYSLLHSVEPWFCLHRYHWRRLVVDELHEVLASSPVLVDALALISAEHLWGLSGSLHLASISGVQRIASLFGVSLPHDAVNASRFLDCYVRRNAATSSDTIPVDDHDEVVSPTPMELALYMACRHDFDDSSFSNSYGGYIPSFLSTWRGLQNHGRTAALVKLCCHHQATAADIEILSTPAQSVARLRVWKRQHCEEARRLVREHVALCEWMRRGCADKRAQPPAVPSSCQEPQQQQEEQQRLQQQLLQQELLQHLTSLTDPEAAALYTSANSATSTTLPPPALPWEVLPGIGQTAPAPAPAPAPAHLDLTLTSDVLTGLSLLGKAPSPKFTASGIAVAQVPREASSSSSSSSSSAKLLAEEPEPTTAMAMAMAAPAASASASASASVASPLSLTEQRREAATEQATMQSGTMQSGATKGSPAISPPSRQTPGPCAACWASTSDAPGSTAANPPSNGSTIHRPSETQPTSQRNAQKEPPGICLSRLELPILRELVSEHEKEAFASADSDISWASAAPEEDLLALCGKTLEAMPFGVCSQPQEAEERWLEWCAQVGLAPGTKGSISRLRAIMYQELGGRLLDGKLGWEAIWRMGGRLWQEDYFAAQLGRLLEAVQDLSSSLRSLRFLEHAVQEAARARPEDLECGVCLQAIHDPRILPCGHIFCGPCIKTCLEVSKQCPQCRSVVDGKGEVSALDLEAPKSTGAVAQAIAGPSSGHNTFGSKISVLVARLQVIQASGEKAVVFAQWNDLIFKIHVALRSSGITSAMLGGSAFERASTLLQFEGRELPVLLLSLQDSASGTNMSHASHVLLVHPMVANSAEVQQAYESQAIGRVRRWGQQRRVQVWRFVMGGTIEADFAAQRHSQSLH